MTACVVKNIYYFFIYSLLWDMKRVERRRYIYFNSYNKLSVSFDTCEIIMISDHFPYKFSLMTLFDKLSVGPAVSNSHLWHDKLSVCPAVSNSPFWHDKLSVYYSKLQSLLA